MQASWGPFRETVDTETSQHSQFSSNEDCFHYIHVFGSIWTRNSGSVRIGRRYMNPLWIVFES
ncbi:hypothetical protein RB213_011388 [Colletotrichum asianum]